MRTSSVARLLCLLIAAVVIIATYVVPSQANQFKRIRDVNVSCNNALRCDLYIVNPAVSLYTIGLRRSAAAEGQVSLFLTMREALAASSELDISIDGSAVVTLPVSDLRYRAASGEYSLPAGPAVEQFIAAAAPGREMRVTYRTSRGQTTATYSLSGFIAGVIFMDEAQGRIGDADALQLALDGVGAGGVGDGASTITWRRLNRVPGGLVTYYNFEDRLCGQMDTTLASRIGGFELQISEDLSFAVFPCTLGGAYNQPFAVFQRSGSAYTPYMLPVISYGNPSVVYHAFNLEWDESAGELVSFFKGRGVGDCGEIRRWSVQGDEFGGSIALVSSRVKDTCDGDADLNAPAWVSVWPNDVSIQ